MTTNPTTIDAPTGIPFIDITREFDAEPDLVLRAWTDPEIVVQWLGPRRLQMRIEQWDARTGGGYRYVHRDVDGTEYGFRGVFHTVGPARIVQTFEFDGAPDSVSLESIAFERTDGCTRIRQRSVFPSVASRDEAIASGMEHGIHESMQRLDEVLAR